MTVIVTGLNPEGAVLIDAAAGLPVTPVGFIRASHG